MNRRYSSYAPLVPGKVHHRAHLLRTARLNAVGKAAVAGACIAAAGLGFGTARVLGLPPNVCAGAGALVPLILIGAVDRHRWRVMVVGYDWGGTLAEVSAVAADLMRRGVAVSVEVDDFESIDDQERVSLRYRNADVGVVAAVLRDHDIDERPSEHGR